MMAKTPSRGAPTHQAPTASGPVPNPDGTLIQYGPNVRMDRFTEPLPNGQFMWNVYALTPIVDGSHPIDGISATTDGSVWVPHGQGSEADAKTLCQQLSGIS